MTVDDAARRALLALARRAIADTLRLTAPAAGESPVFDERRGAFVSLHRERLLRGCMGQIEPDGALRRLIPSVARLAAFEDPRFPPLDAEEFDGVRLEISLLSPLVPVASPDEIEVGRHGVMVRRGGRRGLLLPQVAPEWNWTRDELLSQTCRKAMLPADAWRDGSATIFAFTADVFAEGD